MPNLRVPELAVAPMMKWTTRHQRYFARLLAPRTTLWTEMVVDQTIVHRQDDLHLFFGHHESEHPLVLQLGGNSVEAMRTSAELAQQWGFNEINLNVGCPSEKVAGKGEFGARLMLKPDLVREIVTTMQRVVDIPVTVKCRLGVDDNDEYEFAKNFVASIPECDHFIIHARKCILKGLDPKANRTIPPLHYDRVYRLCHDFPDKKFTLNGGLCTVKQIQDVLEEEPLLHGVMLGRAAFHNPIILSNLEYHILGNRQVETLTRAKIVEKYTKYCEEMTVEESPSLTELFSPFANLFTNVRGARRFRTALFQNSLPRNKRSSDISQIISDSLQHILDEDLHKPIVTSVLDKSHHQQFEQDQDPQQHQWACAS